LQRNHTASATAIWTSPALAIAAKREKPVAIATLARAPLRNLLSLGNDAVRDLVRVRLSLAALLTFRPASQLGVGASCAGLGSRSGLATFRADQSAYVNFVSTVRAFHPANLAT